MELGVIFITPREISAVKGYKFEIYQCFIFNVRIPSAPTQAMEYDETETTSSSRNKGTYTGVHFAFKKNACVLDLRMDCGQNGASTRTILLCWYRGINIEVGRRKSPRVFLYRILFSFSFSFLFFQSGLGESEKEISRKGKGNEEKQRDEEGHVHSKLMQKTLRREQFSL